MKKIIFILMFTFMVSTIYSKVNHNSFASYELVKYGKTGRNEFSCMPWDNTSFNYDKQKTLFLTFDNGLVKKVHFTLENGNVVSLTNKKVEIDKSYWIDSPEYHDVIGNLKNVRYWTHFVLNKKVIETLKNNKITNIKIEYSLIPHMVGFKDTIEEENINIDIELNGIIGILDAQYEEMK